MCLTQLHLTMKGNANDDPVFTVARRHAMHQHAWRQHKCTGKCLDQEHKAAEHGMCVTEGEC